MVRSQTIRAALIQTPLGIARRGTRPHVVAIAVIVAETTGGTTVAIGYVAAMGRVVHPAVAVAYIYAVEIVVPDEIVIDVAVAAAPSCIPSPTAPSAAAPDRAEREAGAE